MNEVDLIVACKKGDQKAQYHMYKKYYGFLMSICLRFKEDQLSAEAALNVGFFKIMTNLEKYNVEIPFKSWMHRIMTNTLIDEYRKDKRRKQVFDYGDNYIQISDLNSSDLNTAELEYDREELLIMIRSLPEITQNVFNLYAIDGFKHKEIASLLDIKDGTSRWHLSSARKLLKEMIMKSKTQKLRNYGK